MADTASEAEVKRNYPVTSGITADAKHEGRQINLVPQGFGGVKTRVRHEFRKGMD